MLILPPIAQYSSSLTNSIQRDENIKLNTENRIAIRTTPRTSSSSSFLHETKQLLEMISSNQNFDLSKLVSEI
jgi:hypothetical protein